MPKNKEYKELSELIQNDIITCVDGHLEGFDWYLKNYPEISLEKMKDDLCQIVVDRINEKCK